MSTRVVHISSRAFAAKIAAYRVRIDEAIYSQLENRRKSSFYVPLTNALRGGKRIRPLLLILSNESTKRKETDPFPAAVAIEFLHENSLIHNSVLYGGDFRSGKAFRGKYSYETALLNTDFTYSLIFDLAAQYSNPRINHELALATSRMSEGTLQELTVCRKREPLTIEGYVKIVSKKTASLFKASASIGALIGDAEEDEVKALSEYAESLGIAYQIQGDALDWKKEKKNCLLSLLRSDPEVEFSLKRTCDSFVVDAKQKLSMLRESDAKALLVGLVDSVKPKLLHGI